MSKISFVVFILGCSLFFFDIAYGIGWIAGWFFISMLRYFRESLLEKIIGDFTDFSAVKYITYLLLVIFWVAIPLLFSFFFQDYINPFAIFAAYFADRILMFITNTFIKE